MEFSFTPQKPNGHKCTLKIAKRLSASHTSAVYQLSTPYPGYVLKIIAVANDDKEAYVTRRALQLQNCVNFPHLYFWTRVIDSSYFGSITPTEKHYVYLIQQGSPLELLFEMISNATQYRSTVLQMILPLIALHESGILHCDVKIENYVNSIRIYDPKWSDSSTHTVTCNGATFEFEHTCDGLVIKPLLIDFGLSRCVTDAKLSSQVVASLHTRPPELVFAVPRQALEYTEFSEACSFGLSVITELCNTKRLTHPKPPAGYMCEAISCIGQQSSIAYDFESPQVIAKYAWDLITHIGYPGDEALQASPLGRVIRGHKASLINMCYTIDRPELCDLLGLDGVDMLRQLTRWDPPTRTPLRQIVQHKYFEPFANSSG